MKAFAVGYVCLIEGGYIITFVKTVALETLKAAKKQNKTKQKNKKTKQNRVTLETPIHFGRGSCMHGATELNKCFHWRDSIITLYWFNGSQLAKLKKSIPLMLLP